METEALVKISSRNIDDVGGEWHPRYNYVTFYERIFGRKLIEKKYPWFITFCPFHNDTKTPNLFINAITGFVHCFACGVSKWPHDFIVMKKDDRFTFTLPDEVASAEELQRILEFEQADAERKEPDELILALEEVRAKKAHEFLFRQPFAMQLLQRDRGLTEETIRAYKIGFMRGAVTFPIYNISGKISSLKFHKKYQTEGSKNQLYPWTAVTEYSPYVVIVEGEFDVLITRQNGFNAVTQTHGANSWEPEFNPFFKKRIVYIAYDNDRAGKEGALATGKSLWNEHCDVSIVQWPDFMKEKEDHVDFFVKYQQTAADYKKLLESAISIINF